MWEVRGDITGHSLLFNLFVQLLSSSFLVVHHFLYKHGAVISERSPRMMMYMWLWSDEETVTCNSSHIQLLYIYFLLLVMSHCLLSESLCDISVVEGAPVTEDRWSVSDGFHVHRLTFYWRSSSCCLQLFGQQQENNIHRSQPTATDVKRCVTKIFLSLISLMSC